MRALAIVALAGCFEPRLTEHLLCAQPDHWCPPPQTCASDGFCAGGPNGGDAGSDGGLPEANLVFVSSEPLTFGTMTNADIVTMADQKCQTLGAKLRAGTYVAWIGTTTAEASGRLPAIGGWARPDGKPFTTSTMDLLTLGRVFYPPRLDDDHADVVSLRMETAMAPQLNASDGCAHSDTLLHVGAADGAAPSWLDDTNAAVCDSDLYLYCFETDRAVTPTPPVLDPSRLYAFVTNTSYSLQDGVGALDMHCRDAATAAGLGMRTFQAFVAPTGQTAASRFKGSTKTWSRLDGVVVANPDLRELLAPISIDETRGNLQASVAFGANSPTDIGVDATNCLDWGAGNVGMSAGRSTRSNAQAFSGSAITCTSAHLYCLEMP